MAQIVHAFTNALEAPLKVRRGEIILTIEVRNPPEPDFDQELIDWHEPVFMNEGRQA